MTIAITPFVYLNRYNKICFSINKEWSDLALKINKNIFMLCDYQNFEKIIEKKKIDVVILSGGGDIYKIKKRKINKLRDEFELKLADYCFKKKIPIIAICRGFQLIASKEGCELKKTKQKSKQHNLSINYKNKKFNVKVNSYHDNKIFDISSNFKILGQCKDGSIEIVSHKKKKLMCFMMHPERPGNNKIILKIFQNFINQ